VSFFKENLYRKIRNIPEKFPGRSQTIRATTSATNPHPATTITVIIA